MTRDRTLLQEARKRAEIAIRALVNEHAPGADIFTFGAIDISPSLLAVWIRTRSDVDRDKLGSDAALPHRMRQLLGEAGYPRSALKDVAFAFESDETVTRDYGGNWWAAIK